MVIIMTLLLLVVLSGGDAPVSVYALHPGLVRTEFQRNYPSYQQYVLAVVTWLCGKDSWHGAQTTIYCAVDESIEKETGKYYRLVAGSGFTFVLQNCVISCIVHTLRSHHIIHAYVPTNKR